MMYNTVPTIRGNDKLLRGIRRVVDHVLIDPASDDPVHEAFVPERL